MSFAKKFGLTVVSLTVSFPLVHASGVGIVSIPMAQSFESPRWMMDAKAPVKGGLAAQMVEAKKAQQGKDRGRCLEALGKVATLAKNLSPWVVWNQIQCAQMKDKKGAVATASLAAAVAKVEAQPAWLSYGPFSQPLRLAYTSGLLILAEQQLKTDRLSAWRNIDKLQQVRSWLSVDERASTYRFAGELAFVEQNLSAAQDFLLRSLNEKESSELRARVESIRSSLMGKAKPIAPPVINGPLDDDLGISEEEKAIFTRMNRAYESQDYVSAVEDGVSLIRGFPGSRRSLDAADKILEIYLGIASRNDQNYRHVRDSVLREMKKADAGRISRWANNAYARGAYLDALNLAEEAYTRYGGQVESTKVLLLAGKSALACGEYASALNHFERLLKQHGGTVEAAEATFRAGLLEFRMKRYPQAAAYFERLLALASGKDFEYRALYWQWRAQQKIDKEKSNNFAAPLIQKFPLTYYGLRAQAELAGSLQLDNSPLKGKVELRLLESERFAWERLQSLIKGGWLKEAERELEFLPEPQSVDERIVRAKLWGSVLRYDNTALAIGKLMDEGPEHMRTSILKVAYPYEYSTLISKESKAQKMDEDLIRSLIRQESSFRFDVRSPSNAIGLMQLVPATGQELATDLKMKDGLPIQERLLDPAANIRLGTLYIARVIKSFGGNVPLALAAYNAGPGRMRRWLTARRDLSGIEANLSSAPEVELWMDELPWEETSLYVKGILRNWLIYKLLDGSKLSLSEPIWMDARAGSR